MPSARGGRVDDRLAVGDGGRHRLLEEDVLAGLERRERGLGVLIPHGHDRDGVDLGIGEQVAIVAIGLGHAELRRHRGQALGRARAQRGELEVRNADDRLAVDLAEPAEADHADSQPLHHTTPVAPSDQRRYHAAVVAVKHRAGGTVHETGRDDGARRRSSDA